MSTLTVNTINETTAANGVSIDGVKLKDGAIDQTAKIVSSVDTFHCATASFGTSVTQLNFNPATNTFYTPVSGIVTRDASDYDFEFTKTGLYQVNWVINLNASATERQTRIRIWATTDASVPTSSSTLIMVAENNNPNVGGGATYQHLGSSFILNVTSTNIRIKMFADDATSTQFVSVSTAHLHSYIQFTNIGASI